MKVKVRVPLIEPEFHEALSIAANLDADWHGEDVMIDPVIEKLIASRRKSVEKLDAQMKELESRASQARNPAARQVLVNQVSLAKQRRDRLVLELEALQADQPELPGVAPAVSSVKPPVKR